MDEDIDKPMRPIIEEFNKSKHVKTVYCCAGHKVTRKSRSLVAQVYVAFEMDKEHVGPFLNLAFTSMNEKMQMHCLMPRIMRVFYGKWPRKTRERLTIHFYSDGDQKNQLNKKQIRIARKYFSRLAEKTAQEL